MLNSNLIVPIILTTKSLYFAEVLENGSARDAIDTLLRIEGVTEEVLGDLEDCGWALQRIRAEESGRAWEEDELTILGDGTIQMDALLAPILNRHNSKSQETQRHFSSFPMTNHLHNPPFRLVSLHPLLSMWVSFLRVPEIPDEFEYKFFLSRAMTVSDALDSIINELGLTKSSPIPGGGNLEYVLEEVWIDAENEKSSRLSTTSVVFNLMGFPFSPNPFTPTAKRKFRICVPDEWYRRTKPRSVQSATAPSDSTLRRLAAIQLDEESSDEGEGTAKMGDQTASPVRPNSAKDLEQRGLVTQGRLSSLFEGWMPHSPISSNRSSASFTPDNRKSVSEPQLLDQAIYSRFGRNSIFDINTKDEESGDFSEKAFEEMLDELGLKGDKRSAMYSMSDDLKKYLLRQSRQFKSIQQPPPMNLDRPSAASYGPSSATTLLPRLVPQLTGDEGLMRRISIFGWGFGGSAVSPAGPSSPNSAPNSPGKVQAQVNEDVQPLQPQTTGSSWSSWWISSGGEKTTPSEQGGLESAKSAKWYIRSGKAPDLKLVKHLITLRVHLSTANLAVIQDFIRNEKGVDMLGTLLAGLVGKGGKRRRLTEIETMVLLEVFKCLRALLNAEGFNEVLMSPLITYISYALHTSSLKVHAFASELLAAICVLDVSDGHKAILAALSDSRIAYNEDFRFETLLIPLRLPDVNIDSECDSSVIGFGTEEEGVLDARVATMTLINALTNSSDDLEERVLLREEFSRRGLNELIVALRYTKPPDSLLTQLNLYMEEKFEDEQDMQERARALRNRGHERSPSDSEVAFQELIQLAKQHGDLYPTMIDILKRYGQILQRDIELHVKVDLLTILDRFVEQAAMLDNFDESWRVFLKRFATSVQHITGQEIEVKEAGKNGSTEIIEQELETLRAKVDELTDERMELRNELSQQLIEVNTLKTLPLSMPVHNPSHTRKPGPEQNVHGLVQRLVQKEKEVLQLRTELDRFKAQNPGDGREADERAKRERDRIKWNTLMEEITKHKIKNGELENSLNIKQKEILYLKRALESVYTRFSSREEAREKTKDADMDAELMAKYTIERLTQKDDHIVALNNEISELKARLLARPKTEQEFKAKSPPPPPPSKNKNLPPPLIQVPLPPLPPPPPPSLTHKLQCSISAEPASTTPPLSATPLPPTATPPSPPPPPPPPPPLQPSGSLLATPSPSLSTNLFGIPPPPPPPPSAFRMGPKLKAARPAKKLKPFFWNKTDSKVNTIWSDLPAPIQVDFSDLESIFILDNTPSTPSQIVAKKKQNITTLLDITRANNIAIMLSRIKMGYPEIRRALMEIDDERLTIDELKAISKQLPTVEEVERIKSFDDVNKLAKADQYFYQIMTIPRLSERLQCMQYRRKFELEIEEIRPDLNLLRNASHELRSSLKFKQILQIILALGNMLNGSTFRGQAQGFQLNSLLKMNETKTAKASPDCPTLLHYLARVLLRKDPSLTTYIDELPSLDAATRVSMQITLQTVNTLVLGLTQVKDEVEQHRQSKNVSSNDRFVEVMQPFIAQVGPNVDALMKMGTIIEGELRSLLTYYGENPDSSDAPKPEEFFGLIASFSSALQKCAFEVRDADAKNPAVKIVEAPPEKTADPIIKTSESDSVTPKGSQGYAAGNHLSVGRGSYDQAIRTMGAGKRRDRPARPLSRIFLDGAAGGGKATKLHVS